MAQISRKKRKFLKENAERLSVADLASQTGLSERQVSRALREMGLAPKGATRALFDEGHAFHSRKWLALVALSMTLATLLIYGRAYDYPFVFDDHHAILDNHDIQKPDNLIKAFYDPDIFSDQPGRRMYRPLVTASYIINWAISGNDPGGWRPFNFVVHIGCGVVLFMLLDLMVTRRIIAALAAGAFTVHPGCIEAVVFLGARSTLMAAFFVVLSLYFFARWSLQERRAWLACAVAAFVGGLWCKENVLMLVPVYPILHWALTRSSFSELFEKRALKAFCIPLAIGVFYLIARKWMLDLPSVVLERKDRNFNEQILTQLGVWWRYLGTMLWPIWLNVQRHIPVVGSLVVSGRGFFGQPLVWLLGWMGVAGVVIAGAKNRMAFGGAFFAATILIPETVTPLNMISADRRLYMPLMGMAIIAASLFRRDRPREPSRPGVWAGCLAAAIVLYIPLSALRVGDWRTERSLFQSALRCTPKAHIAWHGLAYTYAQEYQNDKAVFYLKRALEAKENYPPSLRLLGAVLLSNNENRKALILLKEAVKREPLAQRGWYNLGLAYLKLGMLEQAERSFKKAIEQDPYYNQAYNNIGLIYESMGDYEQAVKNFAKAKKIVEETAKNLGQSAQLIPEYRKYEENLKRAGAKYRKKYGRPPPIE